MRIALVAHHARPTGGQDRYLLELARHLAPRHEVHLVVVRAEGLEGSGITVHELGLRDRPVLALEPRFARRASELVRQSRFDVVHGVGGSLPGATVVTAQYCHAAWHDARRRYRVREGSLAMAWYQSLVGAQAVRYERSAYRHAGLRRVIAVSRTTAGELARHYAVPDARVTVVPNGVDLAAFDAGRHPGARDDLRKSLYLDPGTPVALLIGTYARKGLDTALAAVARASDAMHVVVAGAGDASRVAGWARAAGLPLARVHLLGPRTDVAALYAAADVFILPTRYEPFGMVITEAMASGLPVIVSGCAGAADYITPGVSGYVVPDADDVEGFAAALRGALKDPAARAEMGRAARHAVQSLTWARIAEQTEAVYRLAAGA